MKHGIKRKILAALFISGIIPVFAGIILIYMHTSREFLDTVGGSFVGAARSAARSVDKIILDDVSRVKRTGNSLEVKWILKTVSAFRSTILHHSEDVKKLKEVVDIYLKGAFKAVDSLRRDKKDMVVEKKPVGKEVKKKDAKEVLEYVNSLFAMILQKEKTYKEIVITDDRGNLIVSNSSFIPRDCSSQDWWRAAMGGGRGSGEIYISDIYYSSRYDLYMYDIALSVFDFETQRVEGVIRVSFNASAIFDVIKETDIGKADNISLVRGDDTVILDMFKKPFSHKFALSGFLYSRSSYQGWELVDDTYSNKSVLAGFVPVDNLNRFWHRNPVDKWYLVVTAGRDEIMLPIYILLWQFSIWGGVFVIFLAVLGIYLSNRLVKPLKQLQEGTEIIGAGNLWYSLQIDTQDEIQELADKFNLMSDRLRLSHEKLNQQNDQLKKLNQIKINFLSLVSHELRTPLLIIKESIAQVLEGLKGELNPEQKQFLSIGKRSVTRLNGLIENLLDISKIESGHIRIKRAMTDIRPLIKSVKRMQEDAATAKSIDLTLEIANDIKDVFVDTHKIKEVVSRLIDNAIKFTNAGGKVTISVEDIDDVLHIAVSDSGVGISPEHVDKVFEKFEKLNLVPVSGVASIGIGLAVVKEYVELHGGTVTLESEVDKGSVFTIRLPRFYEDKYLSEYLKDQLKILESRKESMAVFGFLINDYKKLVRLHGRQFIDDLMDKLKHDIKLCVEKPILEMISVFRKGELLVFMVCDEKASKHNLVLFRNLATDIESTVTAGKDKVKLSVSSVNFPKDGKNEAVLLKKLEEKLYRELMNLTDNVKPLGQMLIDLGLLSDAQLKLALQTQAEQDVPLGKVLVDMKFLSSGKIGKMLEKQLSIQYIDVSRIKVDKELIEMFTLQYLEKNKILPIALKNGVLFLAMVNPFKIDLIDELEFLSGADVRPFIAMEEDFMKAISNIEKA